MKRIVSTVKFLAVRGLAFRGSEEKFGSLSNGNFLGCLELLAEYDSFIAAHIERYGSSGRGTASYLSSKICDEFIGLMTSHVKNTILEELRIAKYLSFSVDSTPDITSDHIVAQQANRYIVAFHIAISYDTQRPGYYGRAVGLRAPCMVLLPWRTVVLYVLTSALQA